MSKYKQILVLVLLSLLSACAAAQKILPMQPQKVVYGNEQESLVLQNLRSRVMVTCYSTHNVSAETCARLFEDKGYVRLGNIPYKTANYDFLRTDTYPTRRWRGNEQTPRW